MDGDEGFALIVSAAGAIAFVVTWYGSLATVTRLGRGHWVRLPLGVTPAVCLIGLQYFLLKYAAHEVREEGQYDALFWLGGVAWLYLTTWFLRFAGISARDDVLEMRNPAAAVAVCGAMAGLTICYAASNAGEGPTIWTTFVPAFFGTGAIVLLWILVTVGTGIHEAIAVERDTAAGVRLAGFLIAAGLVLGRAVAGDWHTWEGTEQDFLAVGNETERLSNCPGLTAREPVRRFESRRNAGGAVAGSFSSARRGAASWSALMISHMSTSPVRICCEAAGSRKPFWFSPVTATIRSPTWLTRFVDGRTLVFQ